MWDSKSRNTLVETFLAALKEDKIPWRQCWNAAPVSFGTGKPYRGINNLMLSYIAMEKGYQDTRWLTFMQAQKNGWHIRKGEHATKIEYWHYYDAKLKKVLDRGEVLRIQSEEPERMRDIKLAAYSYNVFNAEQIEGIPPQEKSARTANIETIKEYRDTLLAQLGVGLREGGSEAYYSMKADVITLPHAQHFQSDYSYVCTLLHEAGHATGHPTRLDRPMDNPYGTPEYAKEELRAEIASAFTGQLLGLPYHEDDLALGIGQHKAYIQSWIAALEDDPNELFAAIKDAEQITNYLMEHGRLRELTQDQQFAEEPQLVIDQQQGLQLLDQMDAFRRCHQNDSADYVMRFMEAMVAEKLGFQDRNEWTEALKQQRESAYAAYIHGPEPEQETDCELEP